jgi:cell division protein FtsW (lipid II flippase)
VIYLFTGAIILDAAGVADLVPFDSRVAVWVLAGVFGMGVLMNAISRSTKERRMALVALALSVLCVIVAAAPA